MVHRAGFAGRMGPPSGGHRFTTILSPEMVSLPSYVTFTRASNATEFDSSGNLVTVSTNEPRFDYNPLTLQPRGLLLEGARTNLQIRSNEFTNTGGWGTISATVNQLSGTSIGLNRFEVVSSGAEFNRAETASGATISVTSGTQYALTVLFETTGTSGRLRAQVRNNTGATESRITGAIGSLAASTTAAGTWANVTETVVSGNVRRLTAQFTPNFTNTDARIGVGPDSAVAGQTCVVLAVQFEVGAFPSSYIPTTGTAATRAADASLISVLSSIGFNASEGTLLVEFEPMGYPPASQFPSIFEFQNGALTERILLTYRHTNGEIRGDSFVGGVTQGTFGSTLGVPLSVYKTAVAYSLNNFGISTNGGAVVSDLTATVPVVDRLTLMQNSGGDRVFGWVRRIVYYPTRLPNAQLQALSTI